ncbi:MAG: histidine phosphatase family protein [Acidimicrobiia bacterium]|nr:MAG: histidine phosphatase family protein [Acidimicrobiia bacterium]
MNVVYLVRHGEVRNPNHIVYADLPGFDLSATGVVQAQHIGSHLSDKELDTVISSPLQRAIHTATQIARSCNVGLTIDERLTETRMYPHWSGKRWSEVEAEFPAQLAGYLENAASLSDVQESLEDIARRCMQVVDDTISAGNRRIAIVSHQDPIASVRLAMLGMDLSGLRVDAPLHGSTTELHSPDGRAWSQIASWAPEQDGPGTDRLRASVHW